MAVDIDHEEYNQGLQELQRLHARDALRVIVARAEGTGFVAIADGVTLEVALPWDRGEKIVAADLERVSVDEMGAGATTFDVEIRTKTGGTGRDISYQFLGQGIPTLDRALSPKVPFLSESTGADREKIHVALTPHGGAGTFKVRVYARPRR